mmetsp:Transcript_25086/g.64825  ORF Transcript_25086/g.64825 Transcript_25086/m.64825 type:complete len:424 (-) Transcript_25086:63-1334(-)
MSGRRGRARTKWTPEEVETIYRCLGDEDFMAPFDTIDFRCGHFPTARVPPIVTEGHAYYAICQAIAEKILTTAGNANSQAMRPLHSIAKKIQDMREFTLAANEGVEEPDALFAAFDLTAFLEQPRSTSAQLPSRAGRQLSSSEDVAALVPADCPPPVRDGATISFQTRLLNPYLACTLCMGYFREACTIVECLHTFCKTCIRDHFRDSQHCPRCNKDLGGNPAELVRNDRTLQSIVDKVLAPEGDDLGGGTKRPLEGGLLLPHEKRPRPEVGMKHLSFSLLPEDAVELDFHPRPFLRTDSNMTIAHLIKYVLAKWDTGIPADKMFEVNCHGQVLRYDWTIAYAYNEYWNNPLQDMVLKYRVVKKEPAKKKTASDGTELQPSADGHGGDGDLADSMPDMMVEDWTSAAEADERSRAAVAPAASP